MASYPQDATFLIFAYNEYHPGGGLNDLAGVATGWDAARSQGEQHRSTSDYVEIALLGEGGVRQVGSSYRPHLPAFSHDKLAKIAGNVGVRISGWGPTFIEELNAAFRDDDVWHTEFWASLH